MHKDCAVLYLIRVSKMHKKISLAADFLMLYIVYAEADALMTLSYGEYLQRSLMILQYYEAFFLPFYAFLCLTYCLIALKVVF